MIVGGIVFRVVTFAHPGCPKLDKAGAPSIRTEYLASEQPQEWTLIRANAHFFGRHLDAEFAAKRIGSRCHAAVATPFDQEAPSIPDFSAPPLLDKKRIAELKREALSDV